MNANSILHSDVLDILFENRNKQYGAYTLRKEYNKRLLTAIGLMFSLVGISIVCLSFKPNEKIVETGRVITLPPDPHLENIEPPKKQPEKIVRPKQEVATPKFKQATIQSTTIAIVPDDKAPKITVPKVDDLEGRMISNKTTGGVVGGDNVVQPQGNGGGGTEKPVVDVAPAENNGIVERAEFMPEFPGGASAMTRFLLKNLRPMTDDEQHLIKVIVRFIVDKQGSVTGFEVVSSGGAEYDKEVLRVLKKMPAWKPGSQNGHAVNVYMTLPVVFETQAE